MSLDEEILRNLLVEREMAIAKLMFVRDRLDRLDEQIEKLRQELKESEKDA